MGNTSCSAVYNYVISSTSAIKLFTSSGMISAVAGLVKEWILLLLKQILLTIIILIEKFREDEFIEIRAMPLYIPELLRYTECKCKMEVVVFVSLWYVSVFD